MYMIIFDKRLYRRVIYEPYAKMYKKYSYYDMYPESWTHIYELG